MKPVRKKSSDPAPASAAPAACLIYGADDFLVTRSAKALIDTVCPPEEQVLGVEQVDGRVETVDAAVAALRNCITAVRTVSFLCGRKVVWFRDVAFLKMERVVKSADAQRWLGELIGLIRDGLPPGHILVLTAPEVDGRSALYKAFKTSGRVVEHRRAEKKYAIDAAAESGAREAFAAAGVRIDFAALREFASRVGSDARANAQEAEKLIAWVGERREVGVEDVRLLVPATRESASWDLADAISGGNVAAALATLRRLRLQSEEEIGLISGLESRFRDLMLLRDCHDRGWVRLQGANAAWTDAPEAVAALAALGERDPRRLHPFRAGKLIEEARKHTPERLRRIRAEILDTRERMVSGFSRMDLLLEFLILRLCGAPARR